MNGDNADKLEVHVYDGGQFNFALDHAKINAVQNISVSNKLKKRLTPSPIENFCFIGRENEKKEVIDCLSVKHKIVLNGIGGIGKTALAKQVYFELESMYAYVAWINYNNTWIDSVLMCIFTSYFHFDKNTTKIDKYNIIIEHLTNITKRLLIVIDNFNSINSAELSEILKLPADILITSRCQPVGIQVYTLDAPNEDDCVRIFKENYIYSNYLTFNDDKIISDIIEKSHRYTLVIELLAKSISYRDVSLSDFYKELRSAEYQLNNLQLSANSDWNDSFRNEDISLQVSKVYKLSDLSKEEQIITQLLSILPAYTKISYSDFNCWFSFSAKNYLVGLENKGWIKREYEGVYMHEIICECIYRFNPILYSDCVKMLDNLQNKLKVGPGIDTAKCVKYAEYALNIIRIKKEEYAFCRHLINKEAALVFKEVGKYNESKEMLDIIISNYNKDNKEDIIILAELYNNYSKIFSMESNLSSAIDKVIQAEMLIDSISDDNSENYYFQKMIIKKTVGMQYAHLDKYNIALQKLNEAVESSEKIGDIENFQIANLFSDYSLLLYDIGDIKGSIENYKKVLSLYDEHGITQYSPWRNTTYTNYADSLILNNQYENAIYYEYQALIGKYKMYQTENNAIANALLGMGDIFRKDKHLWDVAAVFYHKAASIYKKGSNSSDGYCDAIACLSIVTNNYELSMKAYDIILNNISRTYYLPTYIDVMCSLKERYPEKVIKIGERAVNVIKKSNDTIHIAEQYIYALLGQAYYNLYDTDQAKFFLNKAIGKMTNEQSVYYQETQKIIDNMPSLIGE